MKYKVWVCLEAEFDDIEADSEEEAFIIASNDAMSGCSWQYEVKQIDIEKENEREKYIYNQE